MRLNMCLLATMDTKPHILRGERLHILVELAYGLHITLCKDATYRCTVLDFDLHRCLSGRVSVCALPNAQACSQSVVANHRPV